MSQPQGQLEAPTDRNPEESTVDMRAVAAHAAVRKLLDLLVSKNVITSDEAYAVLQEGADIAQNSIAEIQAETTD